jgi:hypothetical protein
MNSASGWSGTGNSLSRLPMRIIKVVILLGVVIAIAVGLVAPSIADAATDPTTKSEFQEIERRWLERDRHEKSLAFRDRRGRRNNRLAAANLASA